MSALQGSLAVVEHIPPGVWAVLALANVVLMALTWRVARRRLKRLAERASHPDRFDENTRKRDTALTVASLVPAALFWGMVIAGSFHGLVAFGRNVLEWNGGAEYLVPGTLDGVSVTFAFLAFRAIHKQRDPSRSQRVVWAASLTSATVNFAYEYMNTHNLIAASYLGVLSVFGVVIFHEFLSQFEEGAEYVRKAKRPPYGLRWLTWPSSTFCSFIAWQNYPPAEGTPATVLNGLANLERVRAIKRGAADAQMAERHQRALEKAHRKAELAAVKADPNFVPAAPADEIVEIKPLAVSARKTVTVSASLPEQRRTGRSGRVNVRRGAVAVEDMKVPATAATVIQWASVWVKMCANQDDAGPLDDDQRAREVYGLSARQLRNIRNAARTGALARKARELRVELPTGYIDRSSDRFDDREVIDIAA